MQQFIALRKNKDWEVRHLLKIIFLKLASHQLKIRACCSCHQLFLYHLSNEKISSFYYKPYWDCFTVFSFGLLVASTSKPILKQNNQCSLKQNNKSEQLRIFYSLKIVHWSFWKSRSIFFAQFSASEINSLSIQCSCKIYQ